MSREILREGKDFESSWITEILYTPVLEDVGTQDVALIGIQMNDKWYGYVVKQDVWPEFRQKAQASLENEDVSVGQEYNEQLKHAADQQSAGVGQMDFDTLQRVIADA